ncbi:hypothetical protein K437DRAFT_241754 [Tilletiaria anomala UBC 951]|uniref:Amino acid transporter transmembrane domain-containing protein n=1 Tax=Tilletiaria anomala (strain ATCC 24038 / CBS 436.72 / UBC 951) TaxID=1037660 RepID=A0A066WLT6_TILAU|nr:uncharacterized protein K437DRAFT_241754 [Tilletiaria anomala UBC 951]KDN53558.1 hypothetical protein K437DRAFT_241754 [Tilletiaria anomala UBC 951]
MKLETQVLFALDDDDGETGAAHDAWAGRSSTSESVSDARPSDGGAPPVSAGAARYGTGLKSTASSREAQFDLDSDELDDADPLSFHPLDAASAVLGGNREGRQISTSIPLIDRIPDRLQLSMDGLGTPIREGLRVASRAVPGWDGEGLPDWLKRGAGTFDGTVNMANSILGAGIVGLPYSMRESGFVAGVVLLIGLSFLTDWTIRLIVLNAKLSGRQTYIEIMEHCFGGNGKAAVSIFQFAFAFGGMCAFCVVIGDTIPHVIASVFPSLEGSFLANRQFVITACTLGISYPLSLYRNIESLSKASAFALVSMVLIILTVIIRGPAMPAELTGDPSLRFTIVFPSKIIRSIAVISFAFVCHHNSLLIYGSLKEPSMDKFGKVTHYSTLIAGVAATSMSIAGYWSFEDKTLANILNNFPASDTMVNFARFCFGANMLTTFPLECLVCREVLETYFFAGEFDQQRHLIFTSALVVSSLIVSLMTCDLGIVLELTGGLSATVLAYIFPALCYLKLSNDAHKHGLERPFTIPNHLTSASSNGSAMPSPNGRLGRSDGYQPASTYDDEDRGIGRVDDMEGGAAAGGAGADPDDTSVVEDVDEVELPLRPGANIRHRPAAQPRRWWESTKPLAAVTALFGVVVLIVSVVTALRDAASGRGGATHQC